MNAASRALEASSFSFSQLTQTMYAPRTWLALFLCAGVLLSALGVVYLEDMHRRLYVDLQMIEQSHNDLRIEADQLLLERNTWSAQARVQSIAHDTLGMQNPDAEITVRETRI